MVKDIVACEFSGVVRDTFLRHGHDARSCDLLPTESKIPGRHYHGNIRDILDRGWDMMIVHPPCTRLAVSGAGWFRGKEREQDESLDFVRTLLEAPIPKMALENPIGVISTRIRKPDQIFQPWWFGHGVTKATYQWLKNLPKLAPTNVVEGRPLSLRNAPERPDRWKIRSRTFTGVAKAMASQWGG